MTDQLWTGIDRQDLAVDEPDVARKIWHELSTQVAVVADLQAVPELEQVRAFQDTGYA